MSELYLWILLSNDSDARDFMNPTPAHPAARERDEMASRFAAHVEDPLFPCVGARSAFNKDRSRFGHDGMLGMANATGLCADLFAFSQEFPDPGNVPVTFIAMFAGTISSEEIFAVRMWE